MRKPQSDSLISVLQNTDLGYRRFSIASKLATILPRAEPEFETWNFSFLPYILYIHISGPLHLLFCLGPTLSPWLWWSFKGLSFCNLWDTIWSLYKFIEQIALSSVIPKQFWKTILAFISCYYGYLYILSSTTTAHTYILDRAFT